MFRVTRHFVRCLPVMSFEVTRALMVKLILYDPALRGSLVS